MAPAGSDCKRIVKFLVLQCAEVDPRLLNHASDLAGRDCNIDVRHARRALIGSCDLELLRGARNCRHHIDILGIPAHLFGIVGLHHCTEHLLRGLAGRQIVNEIREVMLAELDPSRRAGGNHRQNALVLNASDQLGCLLDNGQVGGQIHIEHAVKAQSLQRGNHLALGIGTRLVAEALTDLRTDRRCGTDENVLVGICQRLEDLIGIIALVQRTDRAGNDALSAVDAGGVRQRFAECGADVGIKPAVVRADDTDSLHLCAGCHTATAENALVVVADDRRLVIDLIVIDHTLKAGLIHAVFAAERLQLAVG